MKNLFPVSLRCRLSFLPTSFLIGLTILGISLPGARAQSPVTDGEWDTLSSTMPINPIHCGLMHTGKVLVVSGSENDPSEDDYYAGVYDPATGSTAVQELQWDVFCNGMATLADGRFLIVGGTDQYDPFTGDARASIFDPVTEKFNEVESMAQGRWYATVTGLGDGRLMTFSGYDGPDTINNTVEIYQIGAGWSPQYLAPWTPPLYPRMHLLPDGTVFYSGPTDRSCSFDPATQTWNLGIARALFPLERTYGTSILLPLRPETGYAVQVMIMGGSNPATDTAEIIDLAIGANPVWRWLPSMSEPRIEMNAVILPTGKVLALGGSAIDEDPDTASLNGDLFDPVTETWSSAGVATYPRLYHSCALLLPDATVWVAGSNPVRGTFEQHMEVYSPAYLYTTDSNGDVIPAPRPVITAAPTEIGYGARFKIITPESSDISSVVLVRPGAVTHAFDMEQRLIGVSFQKLSSTSLNATAPPNGFIAPPGYYLLFLLNQTGVPSLAKFVHLSTTPRNAPPDGRIASPKLDRVIHPGDSVRFAGTATDRDGTIKTYSWIFPGGTPSTSAIQSPGPVKFNDAGTYVISMTAIDNLGVNDPSPPTRTIVVQP